MSISLPWGDWYPLSGIGRNRKVPATPGLYRIRRIGREHLDYIGQTGNSLRGRLAMLRGVFADEMPYRDPHIAAPALWALRHESNCDFEASVVEIAGTEAWRKGLESLAIALYRQQWLASPTIEFGRMPVGYWPSSGNSAKLVAAGKRFKGGLSDELHPAQLSGIAPAGPLSGDPQGTEWAGHEWSVWIPLESGRLHATTTGSGLYRIRGDDSHRILYVGQGVIANRLLAHAAKRGKPGSSQGAILRAQSRLEGSWVANPTWEYNHRLELENDLIAAHVLELGVVPDMQFLGS
jgi:hypothetical protein